jgi:hypothetical protein
MVEHRQRAVRERHQVPRHVVAMARHRFGRAELDADRIEHCSGLIEERRLPGERRLERELRRLAKLATQELGVERADSAWRGRRRECRAPPRESPPRATTTVFRAGQSSARS